ncbi:hypothetical protein N7532_006325 [Penicillium argentinense]|uniref:Uncharacterized protein n=1 Tax=Penicillium argentinense TaxID=1131581 RepID=A0A9W9FFQ6_9EURO|nr:uncharacterized protein N7532_006325 [Penicillium argentinense]KAJ5099324.1 hypothetical protein N7532_006325 [Penicillium argentinense]
MGLFEATVTPSLTVMTGFGTRAKRFHSDNASDIPPSDGEVLPGPTSRSEFPSSLKTFAQLDGSFIFYILDPKAHSAFISIIAAAIPNGVLNSFSTIIIKDVAFSTMLTTELKSVGGAVLIIALIIGGVITPNVPNSRLLTSTAANILCTVAAGYMTYLPRSHTWTSTAYCWGNFAGPFVVKESQAPEFKGATIGLLGGYLIKTVCQLSLLETGYMFFVIRRRDSHYGTADKAQSDEAGMRDCTEFVNKNFRYVL